MCHMASIVERFPIVTSPNRNIFHVTVSSCTESTGDRLIPVRKGQQRGLWCFFVVGLNKLLNTYSIDWLPFRDDMTYIWRRGLAAEMRVAEMGHGSSCLLQGQYQFHNDVIMSAMTSLITGVSVVYSTVCSEADESKHQSSASLADVRGIRRLPVNSPPQRACNVENVSIWWRHHGLLSPQAISLYSRGRYGWYLKCFKCNLFIDILNTFKRIVLRPILMISPNGSGNDLVSAGNKPLHAPMLTQIYVTRWHH